MRAFFQRRWATWLDQRIPSTAMLALSHRSVFILPSRVGFMLGFVLLVMLVTAINYQNSLIYAVTFWLFSVALTSMWFTFANLSGLTLTAGHANPVFAGEMLDLPVTLSAQPKRMAAGVLVGYRGEPLVMHTIPANGRVIARLSQRTTKRGYFKAGRLRVESRFPLGFYTAWSWVALDYRVLVYPAPESSPLILGDGEEGETVLGAIAHRSGEQDFNGLRNYQPGDSMRQIAWKHLARGKGLMTKQFDHDDGALCWLRWDNVNVANVERRLSRLCGWVLEAHHNGWRYGLQLPTIEIPPANSDVHLQACLEALALYGQDKQ
ncbi:DUF58 domain-containing protein [Thalassolituus oleivorans]|nr:DUF58 domain-containing protein [Thalassolituus oleivorans]AHK16009.1 hypothetical protein R615_09795 [Thalassolituus oleivorans R6-15]APR67309.1 hypothetical protein CN03_10455 [Thalassolituus oleivorans]MBQ0728861.1 DUF58 domain-containing protein [Thalassolituus oleivorans]MDF1639743.1 DUF58 domain-containing protein [Thalassolituus oleivorans]